jgi:heme oxygenase
MSLKEFTKEKHTEAERTPFMRAVLKKKIPLHIWRDFTFQKYSFYKVIEDKCRRQSLLGGIEGIERTQALYEDYSAMEGERIASPRSVTNEYISYLDGLTEPEQILAHLYVWHMGDLFGGQMIKEIVEAPHASLEFENVDELKNNMRTRLNDKMGPEANNAFDWAIKMMNEYNDELAV